MPNYCLDCHYLEIDTKQLALARLIPSTKLQVECTIKQGGRYASGTYEILKNTNVNHSCFTPRSDTESP